MHSLFVDAVVRRGAHCSAGPGGPGLGLGLALEGRVRGGGGTLEQLAINGRERIVWFISTLRFVTYYF